MNSFLSSKRIFQISKFNRSFVLWLLIAVIVLFSTFPFYWAIVSSLRFGSDIFDTSFWPTRLNFNNYKSIFTEGHFGQSLWNSIVVALSTVGFSLGLAVFAAYSLGRVAFKGRRLLLMTILSISMFPQVAVLSGMFELLSALGLYDNRAGLVLSYTLFTLPFMVWLLTTFMKEFPKELEEAAIVDGASPFVIVTRVFMPVLSPAIITSGLLAFIAAWSEFLFALTFTLSHETRTVPVAISMFSGSSAYELPWGIIMAASVVVTIPLVVLVLIFQRRIVAGLTAGAVKG